MQAVPTFLSLYSAFFHAVKINSGLTATSFNKLVDTSFDSIGDSELEARVDGGFRVRVDPREYHGRVLWVHGTNDRKVSRVVNALLRPGDILLDIGANYASIGLAAAERVGPLGHVHLFEPQPTIAQAVHEAIGRAGVRNVTLHELALYKADDELTLRVPAHHSGLGTLLPDDGRDGEWRSLTVRTRQTQRFVKQLVGARPFGVKIDIEGAEPAVLEELLPFERMRFVVFEGCSNERWLFDRFSAAGFVIFGLKRSPLRCRVERVDEFSQWHGYHDFVAVRRPRVGTLPSRMHPKRLAALMDDRRG
jgi:FkbM family methyltransferase